VPVTASSLIHTFAVVTRDFIRTTTQRLHRDREVFIITNQNCQPTSVSLALVSPSRSVRDRTRDSAKILSASKNLIRLKLCAKLIFIQNNGVKRCKVIEVLNRFPFFRGHTANVESEAMERSSRGERETQIFPSPCCYYQCY